MKRPYLFDEFFSSGKEESISPFLTPQARLISKNLSLKIAATSSFSLILAFAFSFSSTPISNLFLSFVFFLSGIPALIASLNDLKNLEINIDVLMTLAAFLAVAIDSSLEGALLLVLFELSHGMEETVSNKARSALHNLNNIAPKFALLINEEGTTFEKAVRDIQIGEKILVRNGEISPLDGKVVQGSSSVSLVHLTGESSFIPKTIGDLISAGARNLESALVIEVNRTSSDSTLARIIQLITAAQEAKPRLQRWLDRFGKHYATSVIVLTFLFSLAFPFLFNMSFESAVYRSLSFLIAASPCALIIATPTAYLSAISASARKGILLKGGITLDALASCSAIAFDKTGTLTTGALQCISIQTPDGKIHKTTNILNELKTILSIAYGLERHVVHPIATAICKLAQENKIPAEEISSFKASPGFGLEGIANGLKVAIGLPSFIGAHINPEDTHVAALLIGDKTYLFRFVDEIRPHISTLIQELPLSSIMLTGDHLQNATTVAKAVGITQVYANLRPEDKLDRVSELAQLQNLAMVGDGINDAPALARATVGISMGKMGSATAVDASDVVLLNDDLHLLAWLFKRAKLTTKIVKQNLSLALGVIFLATTPALLGLVPLWLAVILHEGGTVLVGLNSLRLLRN
jgi:Cd2+/Zn2+-exporting ATPase